jgi:hypothetical protein
MELTFVILGNHSIVDIRRKTDIVAKRKHVVVFVIVVAVVIVAVVLVSSLQILLLTLIILCIQTFHRNQAGPTQTSVR